MDASFQSHFNGLSSGASLHTKKSQTFKMIETHFYRLYSITAGSKIIAESPSKVWYLILQLLSVFILPIVVIMARVCHTCAFLLKKLSCYKETMADKWV